MKSVALQQKDIRIMLNYHSKKNTSHDQVWTLVEEGKERYWCDARDFLTALYSCNDLVKQKLFLFMDLVDVVMTDHQGNILDKWGKRQ